MLIEVNDDTIADMKRYFKSQKMKLDKKVGMSNAINSWLQSHLQRLETKEILTGTDGEVAILDDIETNDEEDIRELSFE